MHTINVGWLARLIAAHGAWSLFRLYPDGMTIVTNETRGEAIWAARKAEAAALAAVFAEANGSRWDAVAAFRKGML